MVTCCERVVYLPYEKMFWQQINRSDIVLCTLFSLQPFMLVDFYGQFYWDENQLRMNNFGTLADRLKLA